MTSPRRSKKSGAQCAVQILDWDSPSTDTGTVKRRRSSCPENSGKHTVSVHDAIFEVQTPSDSGSGTSRSIDDNDKSDSLTEVEERISCIINENRSSKSNSESSDADIIIDNILGNPNENLFEQHDSLLSNRSKTFIKKDTPCVNEKHDTVSDEVQQDKKVRDKRLKTPAPIKKLNKTFDKSKNSLRLAKEPPKPQEKASVLPVYKSTVQGSIDLNSSQKKKVSTKLKLPFAPVRTMEKSKMNFFQNKPNLQGTKPSPLLSSPVRRTMSNEYVRLKFNNDTVVRRTINGKSVPKITPKIQSIIPESPIDSEDPFLNLSPNKKYTVTVNNKVRCDKDNYVIFDPNTGFAPDGSRQSRIPLKSPTGEKSRIPLKSPCGENSGLVRKSANVSDTDSGILSPNSPVETSEKGSAYYVNAAAFSESAKKFASDVDITILDPGLAKKAAEQIKIYTDWANHYLERARSRRRAGASGGGLARDCADGLLLADVLEGVTGLKVHRAHRKPRNPQQMLENVQCCLDFLHAQKVQGLEQVTAVDIRDAKLKAVLALFFALSRHKQATKQRTTPSSGNATNIGKNSSEDVSLSAVQRITGGSSCDEILTACTNNVDMTTLTANRQVSVLQTSIPLPASAAAARRAPPDKRPLPATPSHTGGKSGLSASSSRSTSPLGQGAVSFIPRAPTSSSGSRPNSSLLAPGSKIPSTLISQPQHQQTPSSHNGTPTKHSMLDKLKLFNKDKISNEKQSSKSTAVSKRTSSSSGFSSAKSERSDSSLSLNESSNTPNSHIKSTNLVGPKSIRQQSDTLSKDKSGKNVKPKLVSSKSPKETSTGFNKNSSKTSNSDKSRNSPKLPARDKESKLAAPKSISNTKLNQIDDHSRNSNSKMVKLSGSQMRLSEKRSDSTPDVKHHQNHENASPPSKSHGNQNQAASAQNFGQQNHTGIPKPTAAVKGTFKISKDDRHVINKSTNSQLSPIQSNSSLNSTNNVSALPFGREQSNLSKDITQKQTLAVSPMPVVNTGIHTHISQMSESSHSNSTHSTTGQHSNSSDSSVIYRPSSESGSEISKTATHSGNANKRIDMNTTYINEVINEAEISEKEAAQRRPLDKSVPKPTFDHNRTLTELNKRMENDSRSSTPSHCRDNSLGDDENPLMNVMPMRPLLRGYNSHLTLPMRTSGLTQKNIPGYPHHANTVKANFGRENMGLRDRINYGPGFSNPDYCDLEIASGYMSDGDCLRRININEMDCGRNNDIMDGYMSEGGASLYGRRLNYQQPSQLQQLDERRGRNRGMEGGSGVVYRVVGRTRSKADCGQQTERQPPAPRQDTTWKKYTDSPGVGTPPMNQPAPAPPSPSHGRKGERRAGHHSPQHHKREKLTAAQQLGIAPHPQYPPPNSSGQHPSRSGGSQLQSPSGGSSRPSSVSSGGNGSTCSSGKAKVPQSFGYVKRQNGVQQPAPQSNGPPQHGGRTAQVSAVPRTKVKVSGGTQTCTQDLQIHKNGIGPKSFSLGGTAAAQLSASVRERLLGSQSLPKPGTHEFAALFHHHRVAPRGGIKISDGSLSDTQTYSEVKSDYGIPYAPWLRHSNTYSASGRLSEGESMESLTSLHSAQAHNHTSSPNSHHRSSLTHNKLIMHRDAQGSRLNRSNSIRSTKSEKLYPSMLQRSSESDYEPYYCLPVQYGPAGQGLNYGVSEPPSPSPRSALSPTHQPGNVMHTPRHSHHYPKKNDDVHGSTASLVSTASSLAAGAGSEERQAHEVRKLRRELADAKEKVHTLTTQLTTNAHVVSAFEQSLSNMTQRLQQLTATAERKDSELTELRQTIELLRKQSIQAGLTTAHMQSMGIRADGVNVTGPEPGSQTQSSPQRTAHTGNGAITRHLSTDSVSSINSLSSGSSAPHDKKHKKKGWLRSSFTKAFSRNAKISKTAKHSSLGQLSSQDSSSGSHHYDDPHTIREGSNENSLEHSHETLDVKDKPCPPAKTEDQTKDKPDDSGLVDELKRQLREKDLVLTDIRLEALSSAHQLESLKDTVIKMRNEMLNLKQNNERLQRLVTSRSLAGSQSSLGTGGSAVEDPRRFSLADQATMHQATLDMHSQPLDLDFNCMSSTPTMDFSKKGSPKSSLGEPIYGNKAACELNENSETLLGALNGSSDLFANGLNTTDRLSGDYDINSVLPPPKSRELAIGESYSDIGVADSQGDTTDGKKIAIAVYLGQPETFQRYFEEVQDTLTESECRFYAKQSASAYNNHFEKQSSFDSPRLSQNRSPETETQDYTQINKSNTNSLKSNKSTHSNSYKNVYNSDSTINCNEFTIAYTYISGKTTWQNLDYIVRKTFKDYLSRIDLGTNLGLNTDSITSYHLGEATRGPEIGFPELLPCGYIIGTVNTLYICLEGVGSLAFDSLIPKNIVYRYVSLLSEHRRIILCGPSGTGKSYLAAKLAEFYVQKTQRRGNPAEAVATFNVDRKSCNELRAYLANIAEQCGAAAAGEEAALPSVVILDNLQHASALGDAFAGLLPPDNRNMPVIIGTMSQATCNTTNLQLHHNFRWLLTANHMEPVKGFLARYLRRKLFTLELRLGRREPALAAVLEWLPGVWAALNAFLEAHSSSDVTVGPRLFLACPMDLEASQAWFADVWNYSIVPYASEAVREGIALYGRRRHAAVDPLQHIKSSYPWREPNHSHTLRAITVEDIGIEESNQDSNTNNNQDPLLNMLMRLQEAANYSGNQSQDSDNASMDSNLTHDSSMGNEL
ncbi:protein sickie isoform X14 [Trichoplusia ni]|uniref:Protein sickie isoform X14 n=1 Tax=Trichoplusia ni TaxID=7111 RepID=A0A7E5VCA1_TRINI|nr:protein sickie isoform X14 [Trichoplusia ni]